MPKTKKSRTHIAVLLDRSGSMAQSVMGSARSQQKVANEAAALAVTKLDKTDLVGVIAFSREVRTVVELGPNEDPDRTAARIKSIAAGGGTEMGPALERAHEWLSGVEAQVKHVIVLTDGRSLGAEALPGIIRTTLIKPFSSLSVAPIPSSEPRMLMSKSSFIRGAM